MIIFPVIPGFWLCMQQNIHHDIICYVALTSPPRHQHSRCGCGVCSIFICVFIFVIWGAPLRGKSSADLEEEELQERKQ